MTELSRLIDDLHLRDDHDQGPNRRGNEEILLRHTIDSGNQSLLGRKSLGKLSSQRSPFGNASSASLDMRNNFSHIEDLQQRLLDPTSHVDSYPPLDLDTRVAACFDFQREKSNCVPERVVSLKTEIVGSGPAKLAGIHYFLVHFSACCECECTNSTSGSQLMSSTTPSPSESRLEFNMYQTLPQAPTPSQAYHGNIESNLWTQEYSGLHQDQSKMLLADSRRTGRIYVENRGQNISGHPLLGSSVADLSDNDTLSSFRTTVSPPQEVPTQKDKQDDPEISRGRSCHPPVNQDWETESGTSTDWEALIADVNQRFEHQSGNDSAWEAAIRQADRHFDDELSVQTTVRRQQCTQTTGASHAILTDQKDEGLECHSIAPIPLDYNRRRAPRTPSIHSQGSVLDCTSPSFPKSAKAKLKSILKSKELNGLTAWNLRKLSELSDHDSQINDHIEEWLEKTESVEYEEEVDILDEIGEKDKQKASFPVWSPIEEAGVTSSAHGPQLSSQIALRDMTNLRQPKYLERNSFFQDREKNKQHSSEFIPTPARAAAFEQSLAILEGRHLQRIRESVPARSRSADFESALAFLEGRR